MATQTTQMKRFYDNYQRVQNLLTIYGKLKEESADKPTIKFDEDVRLTDLLRASVVFLHGSEEDYIRTTLSNLFLSRADEKELASIALLDTSGRAEKFSFAQLSHFADYNVGELIAESINETLSKTSFNSYSEIHAWMRKIGVKLDSFSRQKQIDELIKRRHKIVHEVDQVTYGNDMRTRVSTIEVKTVRVWCSAVKEMLELIDSQICSQANHE